MKKSDNLRLDIISTLARVNPGLLTPEERLKVADSIDPRIPDRYAASKPDHLPPVPSKPLTPQQDARLKDMLKHLQGGGTVDGVATPIGTPADLLRGLSAQDEYQMRLANAMMTTAVRGGYDIDTPRFMQLYGSLSPAVQNRLVELKHYYGDVAADRMPFQPRIDADTFMRADGHDMQVAGAIMGHLDTADTTVALAERMAQTDAPSVKKAREERARAERDPYRKPDLRESVEYAHDVHDRNNSGDTGIADASEAFRQQAPSVRDSIVAVDAFLGDKTG